jgi:hypothetical protein
MYVSLCIVLVDSFGRQSGSGLTRLAETGDEPASGIFVTAHGAITGRGLAQGNDLA